DAAADGGIALVVMACVALHGLPGDLERREVLARVRLGALDARERIAGLRERRLFAGDRRALRRPGHFLLGVCGARGRGLRRFDGLLVLADGAAVGRTRARTSRRSRSPGRPCSATQAMTTRAMPPS